MDTPVETMSVTKAAVGLLYHVAQISRMQRLITVAGRAITVGMALNNRAGIGDDQWDFGGYYDVFKAEGDMLTYATAKLSQSQAWNYNNLLWQVLASRFAELAGASRTLPGELRRLIGPDGWKWMAPAGQPLGPNGLRLTPDAAMRLGRVAQQFLLPMPEQSTEVPREHWALGANDTGLLKRYYNGWFYLPGGEKLVAIGYRTHFIGVAADEVLVQIEDDDYESKVPSYKYMFIEYFNMSAAKRKKVKARADPRREAAAEVVRAEKKLYTLRLQAWKKRYVGSASSPIVSEANDNGEDEEGIDPIFLPFILADYLRLAHEEGRIDLPEDARARWQNYHYGELFAAAIHVLRQGNPRAVTAPPEITLAAGTILYRAAEEGECSLHAIDWFVVDKTDLIEFQHPAHTVCAYTVTEDLLLYQLNERYTYVDLERWISTEIDPSYLPSFNDLGAGDKQMPAQWIEHQPHPILPGWHKRPAALPTRSGMVEVMIVRAYEHLTFIVDPMMAPPAADQK